MRKQLITQITEAFKKLHEDHDLANILVLGEDYYFNIFVQLNTEVDDWIVSLVEGPIINGQKIFGQQSMWASLPSILTQEYYVEVSFGNSIDRLLSVNDSAAVLTL